MSQVHGRRTALARPTLDAHVAFRRREDEDGDSRAKVSTRLLPHQDPERVRAFQGRESGWSGWGHHLGEPRHRPSGRGGDLAGPPGRFGATPISMREARPCPGGGSKPRRPARGSLGRRLPFGTASGGLRTSCRSHPAKGATGCQRSGDDQGRWSPLLTGAVRTRHGVGPGEKRHCQPRYGRSPRMLPVGAAGLFVWAVDVPYGSERLPDRMLSPPLAC